ncbi:MAG: hypothetical protein ABR907_01205 [Terracidiphilus sp.]|jgi:hypothetical protein
MIFPRSVSNSTARLFFVLAELAALALTGARAFGQSQTGFTYNGVAYTSYQASEYLETPQGPDGTAAMAAYGVNYATVLATQYVQSYTSNSIAPDSSTPTDAAVVAAIANLRNSGIKVALKPQVDSDDGVWRGEFEPTDSAAWFASYQTFIVHYATIAQAQGVDLFVIGCEFATLSGSTYQSNWETIISAVRAVYTGPITYAANATGRNDEFTTVSFWPLLDLIGVDGYFPLTNHDNPTVAQLVSAWTTATDNKQGFAPLTALQNVQVSVLNAKTGTTMPLIFTEIGYTSTAGTNEAPYDYTPTGAYDPTEQANCYQAFFQVFSQESSWVKGVFWWAWNVSPPGTDDTGYTPQNKPAGDVLAQWYGGEYFTLTSTPAALSVTQGGSANDSITVTNGNGFTDSVTLAVSGLPSGVTEAVIYAPNVPGQTVLGFTASSTAAVGTYPVTVTGTSSSGALTTFTTIALTVSAPMGFTLASSAPALSVNQGSSGTDTITVNDVGGFNGNVTLSASGLPSGVTATFATNPTAGSSVMTLTAGSAAVTGTITITITGNVSSTCGPPCQIPSATTNIALTVNAPSFTLLPSVTDLSLIQGTSSIGDTISLVDAGGFAGSVTLAATGLPSGVTAAFGTNPTSGSSVLTLTASSTAATGGPVTVTITGTSGNLTATTTVALTVNPPPSFTLSASPTAVTILQGLISGTSSSTITVSDLGGFTGKVTLAASGLPSGVTASFGTDPTNGTSTLTLVASSTATLGEATVTITGSMPSVCGLPCQIPSASTTIALTVNPAPSFALQASPPTLTVTQGASGTSNIIVTGANGFNEAVTLTASGLPSGVTASFATNPTTNSSVLTLAASSTAATGLATVTILGSAPSQGGVSCGLPCNLTESTTIALTVNAAPIPGFTILPSPSSLLVTAGGGSTSIITVTPVNGFTGSVALTAAVTSSPSGAQNPPTLSFGSTSPVTISGSANGQATLTLNTTAARGCSAILQRPAFPWTISGSAALACLLLFAIPARPRSRWKTLGLVAFCMILTGGIMACGGSSGSGTCNAFTPGTTTGAYTITVSASSSSTTFPVATTVTLNVH